MIDCYEVWADSGDNKGFIRRSTFEPSGWQFAEKLARKMRENGFTKVEVRPVFEDKEESLNV